MKKLTKEIVEEIRHRYNTEEGITQQKLAYQYGISNQNVSAILTYKTWRDKNKQYTTIECYY